MSRHTKLIGLSQEPHSGWSVSRPTASDATQMVRLMKWLKALLWTTTRHAAWCAGIPTPNAALYSSFGGNGAEADGILFPTARRPLMCSARS